MAGADAVFYLAGIIRERDQTFEAVHVRGVEHAVRAMRDAGVRRLLHVSALGGRRGTKSRYFETKARGEAIVRESGLDWTIFRPSLIFGEGDEFFGKILKGLVRMPLPFIPLAGAMRQSLEKPATIGEAYDLVGPREYPYRALVRLVRDALGSKKPLRSLPAWFFALLARLPAAPITRDQLYVLLLGNTGDPAKMRATFSLAWRPLEAELPRILGVKGAER